MAYSGGQPYPGPPPELAHDGLTAGAGHPGGGVHPKPDTSNLTMEELQKVQDSVQKFILESKYQPKGDEKVPFMKVANIALFSGVAGGVLTHQLLRRTMPSTTPIGYTIPSVLTGLWVAQVAMRFTRKWTFQQILEMDSPLGQRARQALLEARTGVPHGPPQQAIGYGQPDYAPPDAPVGHPGRVMLPYYTDGSPRWTPPPSDPSAQPRGTWSGAPRGASVPMWPTEGVPHRQAVHPDSGWGAEGSGGQEGPSPWADTQGSPWGDAGAGAGGGGAPGGAGGGAGGYRSWRDLQQQQQQQAASPQQPPGGTPMDSGWGQPPSDFGGGGQEGEGGFGAHRHQHGTQRW
uniref:OCIA domain-containing protein n=1 Tax=Vitrella brassicaformis TaxID=1169539 RepID=A0A7S1JPH3_9ALVE|mmetsp:Transcript_16145/g.38613  ORF Transcript_16145/g.38613 Transcript_16145/m.38613 type:complete len:346 (+) Transcript_16145:132-1169(+)